MGAEQTRLLFAAEDRPLGHREHCLEKFAAYLT
jgi:hypothetical protein